MRMAHEGQGCTHEAHSSSMLAVYSVCDLPWSLSGACKCLQQKWTGKVVIVDQTHALLLLMLAKGPLPVGKPSTIAAS